MQHWLEGGGNDYFATPLGALRRDSRGQYSLIASFDPRNIGGRELEAYQLLVAVAVGSPCQLVLSGNVCGSVQMDWERVRREACALFLPGANARDGAVASAPGLAEAPAGGDGGSGADTPGTGGAMHWGDAPAAEAPAVGQEGSGADAPGTGGAMRWEDAPAAEAPAVGQESSGADTPGTGGAMHWEDTPAAEAPAVGQEGSGADAPGTGGAMRWEDAPAAEAPAGVVTDGGVGEVPGEEGLPPGGFAGWPAAEKPLDTEKVWPEPFEAVRALLASGERMEEPPLAGYVFVRAPLADGGDFPYVAVGVRVEDGQPTRLAYAFPGVRTSLPPEGLEDCLWLGGEEGWWLRFAPA